MYTVGSYNTTRLIPQDSSEGRGVASYNIMASRNVPRPQVRFKDQIDNSNTVFVPRIRNKPNARQPLPDGRSCDHHVIVM